MFAREINGLGVETLSGPGYPEGSGGSYTGEPPAAPNLSGAVDRPLVPRSATRYISPVIVSFRHKGLETLFKTGSARGVQPAHAAKLRRILASLEAASTVKEMDLPSYKLHPLKKELKGHWAVWVNGNWRVTFRPIGVDFEHVDYMDYH